MKKYIALTTLVISLGAGAQNIQLPAPNPERASISVTEALATRHSVREYSDAELSEQELSDLCWAACGVTRDANHRTAPTAMNRKEIRLYAFTAQGAYEYLAAENILAQVATGDHRALIANGQDFVAKAPVSLVMVIDFERFGKMDERSKMMGCVDAGNVSENINLYCQSVGLCTVPRATMDTEGIKKLLNLSDQQLPIMNNPVGKPVTDGKGKKRVYDEKIDPMTQIDNAIAEAKRSGKHVICQVGGNWCKWCLRFADFITTDKEIAEQIDANYVYIHVNYSNKSPKALLERLGNPGRFGYPVMVVLDTEGKILHTQDSSFLESGEGYSKKKVQRFLKTWAPSSLYK